MTIQESDWRNNPVDGRIASLVDALNGTGLISTIASCEGHYWRISDPYVYFSCSPVVAEVLARRLDHQRREGKLHYYWRLTGEFDTEHRLGFTVRSGALDHGRGLLRTFWNYVVRRRRIDEDLAVLQHTWGNLAEDEVELPCLKHPVSGSQNDDEHEENESHLLPALSGITTGRIAGSALGTGALGIGSNISSANVARDEAGHTGISLQSRIESTLPEVAKAKKQLLVAASAIRLAIQKLAA